MVRFVISFFLFVIRRLLVDEQFVIRFGKVVSVVWEGCLGRLFQSTVSFYQKQVLRRENRPRNNKEIKIKISAF